MSTGNTNSSNDSPKVSNLSAVYETILEPKQISTVRVKTHICNEPFNGYMYSNEEHFSKHGLIVQNSVFTVSENELCVPVLNANNKNFTVKCGAIIGLCESISEDNIFQIDLSEPREQNKPDSKTINSISYK